MVDEPAPHVLISDAERRRAVDDLFRAHQEGRIALDDLDRRLQVAYAARTIGELSVPLHDLPGPRPWTPRAARDERIDADGGLSRTGAWTVPRHLHIEQGMDSGGMVDLDLTEADVPFPRIDIELLLGVMGHARIVVPHGAGVDVSAVTGRGRPARTDVPAGPEPGGLQVVVTGSAGKRRWVRADHPDSPMRWWQFL